MSVTDPLLVMGVVVAATNKIEMLLGAIDCAPSAAKVAPVVPDPGPHHHGPGIYALGGSEIKQLTAYGFSRIGSAKKLEEAIITSVCCLNRKAARCIFKVSSG